MKKLAFALTCGLSALPFVQGAALAQDAAAGKAYWERAAPRPTLCWACHGRNGEGAFGPDLAGRGLSAAQVARAVRRPWGVMPAFTESQFSDQDAADVAAYFATLPKVAEPGKWRFEAPRDVPAGQASMIDMGCGQCHGPKLDGPRGDMGGTAMDFEEFAGLVYNHTTEMPKLRAMMGSQNTNLAMGNFAKTRLPVAELQSIFTWAHDEIGPRVPMSVRFGKSEAVADGVKYVLTVANGGVPGKGLTAEEVVVRLAIPADASVVAEPGAGYKITTDEKTKASVAEWQLPRSAPKDQESLTITLSKAAPLRGELRWMQPSPKNGLAPDTIPIAAAQ
jgi:cytochrome c553